MWDFIYESANQTARDADAYLELIAPQRDSIMQKRIICVSESPQGGWDHSGSGWKLAEEQELIQEAMDQNIPVVTVLTDDSLQCKDQLCRPEQLPAWKCLH